MPEDEFVVGAPPQGNVVSVEEAAAKATAAATAGATARESEEETVTELKAAPAPKTPTEAEIEAKRREAFDAQQMPVHTPSRDDLERLWKLQAERARLDQLKELSLAHPVVRELVAENEALKAELEALKTKAPKGRK